MKILELCEFSAGICGVWQRVKQESLLLSKKHEVRVFSSNIVKGTNKIARSKEKINGVKIVRFPVKLRIGENALFWDFEQQALEFSPDIIIAHVYRHPHTNKALKIAAKLRKMKKVKVFLVTHAPFVEPKVRGFKLSFLTKSYDFLYSRNLNKFDNIITITKWEDKFLEKLGVKKEKIKYIPNGIPDKFFKKRAKKFKAERILFLGRVSPVKDLETLIIAFKKLKKDIKLHFVGPIEKQYGASLTKLIEKLNLNLDGNIKFFPPVFDLDKKINLMNNSDIFVLPSKREGMPQSLIEAMSLSKIVISSSNKGGKELVSDGETGFIFETGNSEQLKNKLKFCLDKKNTKKIEKMRKKAKEEVKKFKWSNIIAKLEKLFN